jgi:PBP1b-binding outer membrane lipoprotein LpoB
MRIATSMFSLVIATYGLGACASKAKYIETGGTESIVSVGEVDIQDLQRAASGMLESLIAQGTLSEAPNKPARLRIERVVNDTSSAFDVGELTYRMREQLVNSGQATVLTAYGENAESPEAQERLRQEAFRRGESSVESLEPDFFLTGKITQLKRSAGRTRQTTYTFRLTLTNARTGQEAWTKVVDVTKQGEKNAIGF